MVDRVNGAHVPELAKKTAAHSKSAAMPTILPNPAPPKEVSFVSVCMRPLSMHAYAHTYVRTHTHAPHEQDLDVRLKRLVNNAPCMVFMKGTPSEPRCGTFEGIGIEE